MIPVLVGDDEARKLYEIFEETRGEKQGLDLKDFQKALGCLEVTFSIATPEKANQTVAFRSGKVQGPPHGQSTV